MSKTLKILFYPSPQLRKISKKITIFDAETKLLAETLLTGVKEYNGIGLSAIQIGILQRMFVMDLGTRFSAHPKLYINPKIEKSEGKITYEEGCLSIPKIRANITRSKNILLSYQNLSGKTKEFQAADLAAICIQHELDHLNGVLFIDYLSPFQQKLLLKKYQK